MKYYGAGIAADEEYSSGFRLLAVNPMSRRQGVGKLLTLECMKKAKSRKHSQVIIHSTKFMQTAWKMYETMGFKRSQDLDFAQGGVEVFGFRLML